MKLSIEEELDMEIDGVKHRLKCDIQFDSSENFPDLVISIFEKSKVDPLMDIYLNGRELFMLHSYLGSIITYHKSAEFKNSVM